MTYNMAVFRVLLVTVFMLPLTYNMVVFRVLLVTVFKPEVPLTGVPASLTHKFRAWTPKI